MQLPPFELDVWLTKYKFASSPVRYDLASSTGPRWTVRELLDLGGEAARGQLESLVISYLPTAGSAALRQARIRRARRCGSRLGGRHHRRLRGNAGPDVHGGRTRRLRAVARSVLSGIRGPGARLGARRPKLRAFSRARLRAHGARDRGRRRRDDAAGGGQLAAQPERRPHACRGDRGARRDTGGARCAAGRRRGLPSVVRGGPAAERGAPAQHHRHRRHVEGAVAGRPAHRLDHRSRPAEARAADPGARLLHGLGIAHHRIIGGGSRSRPPRRSSRALGRSSAPTARRSGSSSPRTPARWPGSSPPAARPRFPGSPTDATRGRSPRRWRSKACSWSPATASARAITFAWGSARRRPTSPQHCR